MSCSSREMLKNEDIIMVAKIDFHTAENGPSKMSMINVLRNSKILTRVILIRLHNFRRLSQNILTSCITFQINSLKFRVKTGPSRCPVAGNSAVGDLLLLPGEVERRLAVLLDPVVREEEVQPEVAPR